MAGIKRKTPTYLPLEIIENILSRLQVKSLLRFKSVCKQWNATISDPKFAQTHLQISKNSSSLSFSCLLVHEEEYSPQRGHVVAFENDALVDLLAVDYPKPCSRLLCHCDGLYVTSSYQLGTYKYEYEYALWNPSRGSCKNLNQYTFSPNELISGICYDPLLDDYKVVMGDEEHYAVFYCRKNHWSDLKEMNPNFKTLYIYGNSASFKGSIYWVSFSSEEYGPEYEIVYFDGRDEKLKNLGKVGWAEKLNVGIVNIHESDESIELFSSGEDLYLFQYFSSSTLYMKKVGDGDKWMKLPATDYGGGSLMALLCGHEKKLLFCGYGDDVDVSKRSLARVACCWSSIFWLW